MRRWQVVLTQCARLRLCTTAIALLAFVAPSYGVLVDDFNTVQTLVANSGTPTDGGSVTGAGIIGTGGERDSRASWTSGPNDVQLDIDSGSSSALDLSLGSDTLGSALIQWDDLDGTIALDPTGLSPAEDLTAASTLNALGIKVLFDDLPVNVVLNVYTDAGNWSTATLGLPGGIFAPQSHTVLFSSFAVGAGSGANFASVGAIEMLLNPLYPATDLTLDFIESTYVPEPSTLVLAGLGALGLIAAARRRRRAA